MDTDLEKRFNRLDDNVDEIKVALKGDIATNTPGLCERVRNLEKTHKRVVKAVSVVCFAVITQIAIWVRNLFSGS